ncbi:MAG: TonB-dependent receptor [Rariglobus sp.]
MQTRPSRAHVLGRLLVTCAFAAPFSIHSLSADTASKTETDRVTLPPVEITARRIKEDPVNVPAYTQVITREQIEAAGAVSLIDLLENQANLQFTSLSSSAVNTKVSMRGTSTSGNGRTLVLLDGIRTNRPDIGDFNWLQFNLQTIESIEVIQGPQGAFYGDNAVGGVIKINTLGAPTSSGGNVRLLVGSDDTFKISGGYMQAFGNAWAGVSGGYDTSDGYRDHSGFRNEHLGASFGYDNQKNSVTRLAVSYLKSDFDQPGSLTQAQFEDDPTQEGAFASDGVSRYKRVSLSNEYGVSSATKLLTDAGASFTDELYHGGFGTDFDRTIDGYYFSPKLHLERGDWTFTPGVDFSYDELEVDTTGPLSANAERTSISAYLATEWRANDALTLSAAYRHDWNKIAVEQRVPGPATRDDRREGGDAVQVAANYKVTDAVRVYVKYDRAYRFPATDELASYQGFGPFSFNADLKPELSDNYEIGATYRKERWTGGAAIYLLETKDEIYFTNTTFTNENLSKTRRTGVQGNVGYDAGIAGFRAQADYVDARLREADAGTGVAEGRIRMVPEWRLTNTVFVRPTTGLEVSLTHRHIGSMVEDDGYGGTSPDTVPHVDLFDAKIAYRLTPDWRVFAGVNNIADREFIAYQVFGGIYPGQGRFFYAGSSLRF